MTVPPESTAGLSLEEKQARLRKILVERIGQTRTAPASFAQERLWFVERMQLASALYNLPAALRLRGALDVGALERALGEIVRRHEVLRTTFAEVGGAAVQAIAPAAPVPLPVEAVDGPDAATREARMHATAADEAARPFDLAAGPLFRARLLRLGEEEHVLVLCMHHAVSDGWSLGVLFGELATLYAAYHEGRPSPLPEPALQYGDYAARQREALRGEWLAAELAWWRARLAGAPALLPLPTDRPRRAAQAHRGTAEPLAYPAALAEGVEALARAERATPYMVLLAAFKVLLARHGAGDDLVVGTPVAGRTSLELEGLIGFFVNTLVLRTDLSGDPTFREVLRRVREATLGAFEHQEVPFEKVVAELAPDRSLSHSPLFQVMFEVKAPEPSPGAMAGLAAERVEPELDTTKFDLGLALSIGPDGISGFAEYATDLFDRDTIRRMLRHLERVLAQALADPDVRISRIGLADEGERSRVVDEWNRTDPPLDAGTPVHRLFEAWAARTPVAPAVVDGDTVVTYGELDARANRLARHLARLGVGPEARVGVCLERSVEMLVALLAVLKAGAAYLPLDPGHPSERLRFMLGDAGARVLVTQSHLRVAMDAGPGVAVVAADAGWDEFEGEEEAGPRPASADWDSALAYVIYTSGSTGTPKGVGVEHRSLANYVAGAARYLEVTPADRILQFATLSFDTAAEEIYCALCSGAALVLRTDEMLATPAAFWEACRRGAISLLDLPTAIWHQRVAELDETGAAALPPTLRLVLVGGEGALPERVVAWRRTVGDRVRLVNGYGPTETTIVATLWDARGWEGGAVVPIGRPVPNTRCYVLDAAGLPVPPGVPGELCVGGVQVARGYLGRPALTAARFGPDPFAGRPGARLYRTGDRARWRPDGVLEYLGRLDQQVKVRGIRIEPGEIEAVLREHPSVRDCAVVARGDGALDTRLVAYVVGEAAPGDLRARLRAALPEYMVPAAFVALDALPLTPHGKVDRAALPEPPAAPAAGPGGSEPRTPAEEVLAGLWCDVLGVPQVGVRDNFFELGGHSLLATLLLARVGEVFGVTPLLRALFEGPTVAELAERVEALRQAGAPALPPVVPVGRDEPLPLSFAQERLWFVQRMRPESTAYNHPLALRLSGPLDARALEHALGELVRRHESLRTTFEERGGAPVQVIAPFRGFVLPVEDRPGLGDDEVRRILLDEGMRPVDLSAGPLFRARLLRLDADEHALLLFMHHVFTDGWSMGVLFRELEALYAACRDGRDPGLAPLPVQYADFAVWQRDQLRGEALERQRAWWSERLARAPALLDLPLDHPRPAVQSFRGAREPFELPAEVAERLRALARGEGATLFMVLLGAFQLLLSRHCATDDVVVGSPIAGRTRPEVEGLIGFFVNFLVLRTDLSGNPTFREVVRRVRQVTLGAYENQELPFEQLVAELQPERSLGHSPLFQAVFSLHAADAAAGGLAGVRVSEVHADADTTRFDLTLDLAATPDGVHGVLEYATDLFERDTIRRILDRFARLLEEVAADPDARLRTLGRVSPAERRLLLEEWNQTDRPFPRDATLDALFAARVRERPDAPALEWGGETLTYAELDARANRLARHLARLGVGPEHPVGVLLERGVELIVSILAVVKAGGCYLALDPADPPERLRMMLDDAGARVLVSRGALAEAAPAGARVVALDACADALAVEPEGAPASRVGPGNLAYLVYTSGSTGRPKGVMVAHGHVVQLVMETDYVRLGPGDRVAQASNASFDALTFEAWGALLNGATLVGIPRDVVLSTPALGHALRAGRITTLYQTTALLDQHVREDPGVFATVREVLFGGQASDAASVRRLLGAGKPGRLLHMYGPTETTAWCSYQSVASVPEGARTVGVGRPTGNARIYLLDAALQPVPLGVAGEACVGGDGVVRGYLGRPGLTAERFVPDPFSSAPGARMYRTGDRLRWTAGGELEFVGRLDDQVKIRGFRIEPGEVESVLAAHPGVAGARVVVREDEPGEKRLVAYVVGPAGADALRAYLRERLPAYMVPAAFVPLERIPLTPTGKLDRRALPAPEYGPGAGEYTAPRTPLEEVLAGIWAEVLRVERVGVDDGFFELGGHSLLATRVVSRVRELFAAEVPLRALFEAPTVAGLAARVEEARRAAPAPLPPVVPVPRAPAMPLSFAQERLWFLDRMQPGSAAYNSSLALRLRGALDAAALERALGEVVRRHESLRTTFPEAGGAPVQVIHPFAGFTLAPEPVDEGDARAIVRAEAAHAFDLGSGPLFRARLLRLGADDHLLILAMHHIVTDGWSLGVLFRELSALYAAYREGRPSPLDEPAVQYADFAAWQRAHLRGAALDAPLGWWKERLAGAPGLLELPTDHPRPPVQTTRAGCERIELSVALAARLRALGRREGATLFMVVLGAFQLLLSKYAGSGDVVVGTPIAGRTRRETEELIGFFVNTLVLRADLSGNPTFAEVLRRVRETTLGAYEHQEVPFERLVEELRPERSPGHSPLFQVMFALDEGPAVTPALDGVEVEPVETEGIATKFDLNLALGEEPGGLRGVFEYNADLFEPATIRRIAGHLERLLERVAAEPGVPAAEIELLSDTERAQVLGEWNHTGRAYSALPAHRRFARLARRAPEAAAVLHEGGAVSYGALAGRAAAVARRLRALGVRPEVPVGLCAGRTPGLLAAVLGIWEAGGAFVPLDPEYPTERLGWIVDDAALSVIVTVGPVSAALPPTAASIVQLDALGDLSIGDSGDTVDLGAILSDADRDGDGDADLDAVAGDGDTLDAASLAYVIHTSGSTGRPKGVLVRHGSLANLLDATREAFGVGEGDVMPALASFAFDIWLFEALLPLTSGGATRLVERARVLDVPALLDDVAGATLLHAVPALMRQIARVERERPRLSGLRHAFVGGDRVDADLLDEMRAAFPRAAAHVLYGPTEATILASRHDVPANGAVEGHPIGRPFGNVRLYVCDEGERPRPPGIPGELLIGGAGVARGYLGRAGQTAGRFIPDPFSPVPGARLYRTGDRARWRADGTLEFMGRVDRQVKVRGYRIEPGEVEAALRGDGGVREAAVVVREDVPGERRLVAYVAGTADPAALREALRRELPEHMVPASVVVLDALPLTPTGKVDERALPAPAPAAGDAPAAPRNAMEERVAEVWRGVLGRDAMGVGDNFFDLGGTSLLLFRVFSQLREHRADLRVVDLFRYTTVEALAAYLSEAQAPAATGLEEIRSRADERRAALRRGRG